MVNIGLGLDAQAASLRTYGEAMCALLRWKNSGELLESAYLLK